MVKLDNRTLVSILRDRANSHPEKVLYRFLEDGEHQGAQLTFGELEASARALARRLLETGRPGDRALLLFPPGLDFITAFFGCLYAGVVAVPAYPPRTNRPDARLDAIARDAQPRFALTQKSLLARAASLAERSPELARAEWIAIEEVDRGEAKRFRGRLPAPEDLAFLQYTSGSTSSPKGVVVSHENLIHNEGQIARAFGQTADAVVVSWLPLYHDMGLIGAVLQPLYLGATCILMSPVAFLQKPLRWLAAIDRYRATTSGGPNFAYEFAARKISAEDRAGLDLSSWEVAFNGAEPVRAATLDLFTQTFGPQGFAARAFYPCYGLAESTLFVSGGVAGRAPARRRLDARALEQNRVAPERPGEASRESVSCGQTRRGLTVVVVDPETAQPIGEHEGRVGEIWVRGKSVARGYWNLPEASAATFGARLEGYRGFFLRTGDLGFQHEGELHITGRLKDLLILRGRNHYPQDLELTAERAHGALRAGCGAAFAVEADGEERLVIVYEVERTRRKEAAEAAAAVRRAVAKEHEVAVAAVVLVQQGAVPKTSSGKIQRGATRAAWLQGELEALAVAGDEAPAAAPDQLAPRSDFEAKVAAAWAQVFRRPVEEVDVREDFFAVGGDSLLAIDLCGRLEEGFGREVRLEELFNHPRLEALAGRLEELTAPRPGEGDAALLRLGSLPRTEPLPASFAQQRLWFLDQLEPGNPVHNIAAAIRLEGRLDRPALARAFSSLLARHPALRTAVFTSGSKVVQRVEPSVRPPLAVVELSPLAGTGGARRASRRLERTLARRSFDLARAPLVAAALQVEEPGRATLSLAFHHIATDGGSLAVVLRELGALYEAGVAGRPSPLPPLPLDYVDFALWQQRTLASEALSDSLGYWLRTLGGAPTGLDLPADRPRPALLSYRGGHLERRLPAEVWSPLTRLISGTTPFMAGLAVFQALLFRLTGRRDLVVGTPVSGRGPRGLAELVGCFINNLALRTVVDGEAGYGKLLEHTRDTVVAGFAHQEVPFEQVVEALALPRDRARTPLFQQLFVWQNAPLARQRWAEVSALPYEIDLGTARFDLALSIAPTADGWLATYKFSTDLFDTTTIGRLAAAFETLLAACAATPEAPLAGLPLLTAAEHQQVWFEMNDTALERAADVLLHQLFEAQADQVPERVALVAGEEHCSYADFEGRANALAAALHLAGVGPETRVAVAAERSIELVLALYGTVKAGAAYLPLDPAYPAERLAFMADDARATVVLTQPSLANKLPAMTAPCWALTGETLEGVALAPRAPRLPATAGDLGVAYVIYTSGSTGRPKGVMVPHAGIVNRLLWMQEEYSLEAGDRVLQKTPASFDVSVWEFFWPLAVGATLVMAPPRAHQDPAWLLRLIAEHQVTTLHFVPSMLQLFLEQVGLEQEGLENGAASLRLVMASGEALPFDLKERFVARLGERLHNLYGPTEASVDVTYEPCRAGGGRRVVPIGRPIANTAIHILDRGWRLCPLGVPGELAIGGVGLARGYLGRPGLSAERFRPHPLPPTPGERLYATGDLARQRPDGALEFLGRLDHQVKVRGVRIELGEIEATLASHPGVREAVVVDRRGPTGETVLVAFWTAAASPAPTPAELARHLGASLPEAMVPAVFMGLAELPLSPNGKVDRKLLPETELQPREQAPRRAPSTPLEARLVALFAETLGLAEVGVDDAFFALGGNSIQGAQLVNRLQKELGEIVYVMALFDAPTPAALAAYLERNYAATTTERLAEPPRDLEAELGELSAAVARRLGRSRLGLAGSGSARRQGSAGPGEGEWLRRRRSPSEPSQVPPSQAATSPDAATWRGTTTQTPPSPAVASPAVAKPDDATSLEPTRKPRALFLLSPFRSGSTLLRVMLAGHSRLFAPPELELLAFDTLAERQEIYSGRESFAREGLVRAVMELEGCDAQNAEELIAEAARAGVTTQAFYRWLEERAAGRLLVDKTPSYALDPETLERAEALFEAPLYVHLMRHPQGTIHSYLEAHMDRVYNFPGPSHHQAERVWLLAHRNILRFLADIPRERRMKLSFEELVREPERSMRRLAAFVGLDYEPGMVDPYGQETRGARMTDGPHAGSRMMGDPKFHQHRGIDPKVAEDWRRSPHPPLLAEATLELAARLGYGPEDAATTSDVPLSFAQERLWFLTQLDPTSAVYNMPATLALTGRLDARALAASFAALLERHQVLRLGYPSGGGSPRAELAPTPPASLPTVDLSALGEKRRETALALALLEGQRPFDLARPPMLRQRLIRLGEHEHRLLVTLHHIASDGWSIGILTRELGAFYGAFAAGKPFAAGEPHTLQPLPIQYADYARRQRRELDEAAFERLLTYWRERLAPPIPALELPTDRPRPSIATSRGARQSRTLPPGEWAAVRSFSRARGGTAFLTLLAAFDTLLHRLSGQNDLLVGIPIANRTRTDVEGLIGFFLNMTVARADLSGRPRFSDLLARVGADFVAATPYQEVPFEKLVEALSPERNLSRTPFFEVQFSLQNTPPATLALSGLEARLEPVHNLTTKFDFTVFLFDTEEGLTTTLEYNADLFDASTIHRLLGHWQRLLVGAVTAPELHLAELPMLAPEEERQLLAVWNEPERRFPAQTTIHQLFSRAAALDPRALAVVAELDELSYGELELRSNRLAHYLRAVGVGPETRVGLALPRCLDMVVAILGVLKAGGAYVPLDPAYPKDRISFMLADCFAGQDVPVLVTVSALAGEILDAHSPAVTVLELDRLGAVLAQLPATPPETTVGADNLAYVIYTSGSTGRPKGVGVAHAQVVRLLAATEAWFNFGPSDVWTLFHSYAFDFSVWELWGALALGGRLVVVPHAISRSPERFYELLATEGVTVLNQTPSAFRQLVEAEAADGGRKLALEWVIFGGEALDSSTLAPWVARHGDSKPRLINMYGITETTVHVTYRPIERADLERAGVCPVGVPIPDLSVHLLGKSGELLPVGVPGEIHVGGAGLARGYLGRPALSAQRFVPDPFARIAGARLYRSGDLARRRPDGDLDYLGRIDGQVKIRGFRIELGEIEAVLAAHPSVRQAAVVIHQEPSGERRLVAYVVTRQGEPEVATLREALRERLPDYMVPATFIPLDRLPLSPSGKLDRRALPNPDAVEPRGEAASTAPRTPAERRLAAIWRDLLRLERVGAEDDFFDLGGHSLLVTRLVSRLRAELGIELPITTVFENPTLAGLAARLEERAVIEDETGIEEPAHPITRLPEGAEPRLSFPQERLWFLDQLEPGSPFYNVPVAFELAGRLEVAALARSLSEVLRRHAALRTAFGSRDGAPRAWIVPARPLPTPLVDLAGLEPERREQALARLVESEARSPFALEAPPLLRARLLRLATDRFALLTTVHHIASDGWSMGVLVHEVVALYPYFLVAEPRRPAYPLAELPLAYGDFAAWQRQELDGPRLEELAQQWRQALAGAPRALELPTDRPRPPVQDIAGRHLTVHLPQDLVGRVKALAQAEGATLFMVLLAGWSALLARLSGAPELVLGTAVANRPATELEGLIGFFVNSLPLRAAPGWGKPFRQLVAELKTTTLWAFAHQELPFEKIVEALDPPRDPSRTPLFQAMLVLQNTPPATLELPGLTLKPLEIEIGTAKLDLLLSLVEEERGLTGFLEIATALWDENTGRRWLSHWETVLEAASKEPTLTVGALPLMGAAEREALVWSEGLDREADLGPPPLTARLLEVAAGAPEAIALAMGEEQLSYGGLWRRADALAAHLRRHGVGPETVVGLELERSPRMLIALLAVLRSGGAYLPIDLSLPAGRRDAILADARPARIFNESSWVEPTSTKVNATAPETIPFDGLESEALAYVLFTSGSTGRPKGVEIPRRALSNFLAAMARRPGLAPGDRLLATTTLAFDISGLELLLPLWVGARIELASRREAGDGAALAALLAERAVTVLQATPTHWRLLEESGWTGTPGLRGLVGGEAVPGDLAERLLPRMSDLWNVYGPTETTVWSSVRRLGAGDGGFLTAPLGTPIDRTRLAVVDRAVSPQPLGVPGELVIGGDGVARGYANAPAKTAERFLPDPMSRRPGARLYRTGDLARRTPEGELEFLGRLDHQVKVRGFRIELGEIEAALERHPEVSQAAVVVRGEGERRRLVAITTGTATGDVLAPFLAESLPDYMVPARFLRLERFPTTASGKVDRKNLPVDDETSTVGFRAPGTEAEQRVAAVFAEVLDLERVSADDHFFALGGHSLLAARAAARLRQSFGKEVPVKKLFEAPTVAALARALETATSDTPRPPLKPLAPGETAPLSFQQERLWFLDQLEPGNPRHNLPLALEAEGKLNFKNLTTAYRALLARHQELTKAFMEVEGKPLAKAGQSKVAYIPVLDLQSLENRLDGSRPNQAGRKRVAAPQAKPEALTERAEPGLVGPAAAESTLLRREAARPFNLNQPPHLRLTALRSAPTQHTLLATAHHIACDGWSLSLLINQMAELYNQGETAAPATPPTVSYSDYAAWQHLPENQIRLERELDFWQNELKGSSFILDLPTDRPRGQGQPAEGVHRLLRFSAEEQAALRELARTQGATLFMALFAVFSAVLSRASGQNRFLIGTPVANRPLPELENLVGFFANTLALPAVLEGATTGQTLLAQSRDTVLAALAHAEAPFERLIQRLQPERDLSTSPLFQVMLILHNTPAARPLLGEVRLSPSPHDHGLSRFDLTLAVTESAGELDGVLEGDARLFDAATLDRFAAQLRTLMAALAARPEVRVRNLPMLPAAEVAQLLAAAPGPKAGNIEAAVVTDRLAHWANLQPDTVAADFEGEDFLSYAGLHERVTRLAARLVDHGITPESRVALAPERSLDLLVGPLAVLAAGAAYVPLDPAHPAERLGQILDAARPALLLTHRALAPALPAGDIPVWRFEDNIRNEARFEPAPASDQNLAYVIFTSGSTGRPKGVEVTRGALANFLASFARRPGLTRRDRLLATTTPSFDIAGLELYLPLWVGARVSIAARATAVDGAALVARLAAGAITTFQATPSHWRLLLAAGWTGDWRLRALVGGEALPTELARELGRRTAALWNVYGPTETTIWSAIEPVTSFEGAIPLGRAIERTTVYVLDRGGALAGLGFLGELTIGGDGLARGYLAAPAATAERFVPDPFSLRPGARLYRTGDLARRTADGRLEFAGRVDFQVKVRGFRIELGDIESALERLPEIGRAVVVARGESLVAYLVPADPAAAEGVSAAALRQALGRTLPDYMVPAAFVTLAELPLGPSGKVDRKALPEPVSTPHLVRRAALDPVEEVLAAAVADLLGAADVDLERSFFELGGHSLAATQLSSRLRQGLGVEVPVRWVFESPSLAALAARVRERRRGETAGVEGAPPALVPRPRLDRSPLSLAQERLWFLARLAPESSMWNLPAARELTGRLDLRALVGSLTALLTRHETLRARFDEQGGRPFVWFTPAGAFALPLVDLANLTHNDGRTRARKLAAREADRPFRLENEAPFRGALLRFAAERHGLLLDVHHLVADGWSLSLLVEEISTGYRTLVDGGEIDLAPPALLYRDWAAWHRELLSSGARERQLAYWRARLAGSEPPALPADHRTQLTAGGDFAARHFSFEISAELTGRVAALARRLGASPFMVYLTLFDALLAAKSGKSDVVVGTPIAGRNRAEVEGLVGMFVNTLVLRLDLGGDPSFSDAVARARETTLGAYEHQELPFAELVAELEGVRRPGAAPLADVIFDYQRDPATTLELPELKVQPLKLGGEELERTPFRLALRMSYLPGAATTRGVLAVNTAVFAPERGQRWLRELLAALDRVLIAPERPLSELPFTAETGLVVAEPASSPAMAPVVANDVSRERSRLAGRGEELSEAKRRLLAARLQGKATPTTTAARKLEAADVPLVRLSAPAGRLAAQAVGSARAVAEAPPLFLAHAMVGTAFCYQSLARELGSARPVWGLVAAGLEAESAPLSDLPAMAERFAAAISTAWTQGPCLLAGWSFGGLLAFEVANRLVARGREVPWLALLDSWAPSPELEILAPDEARILELLLAELGAPPTDPTFGRQLRRLVGVPRLDFVVTHLRQAGLVGGALDLATVERMLAVYKAHLTALANYRPAPFAGSLSLFRVAPDRDRRSDPHDKGWGSLALGGVEVTVVPGTHASMLQPPLSAGLARLLSGSLGAALAAEETSEADTALDDVALEVG